MLKKNYIMILILFFDVATYGGTSMPSGYLYKTFVESFDKNIYIISILLLNRCNYRIKKIYY